MIILNSVVLAIDHHPMDDEVSNYLDAANFAFTLCFAIEMVLKVRSWRVVWLWLARSALRQPENGPGVYCHPLYMSPTAALATALSKRFCMVVAFLLLAPEMARELLLLHVVSVSDLLEKHVPARDVCTDAVALLSANASARTR